MAKGSRALFRCLAVVIVAVFAGCEEGTDPAVPVATGSAEVLVDARASGFGTADGVTPNTVRVRVLAQGGALLREFEGAFSENPERVFGPYAVLLPEGPIHASGIEVEVVRAQGDDRLVIWSGSAGPVPLAPGDRKTVAVELLRGPLAQRGLSGLSISGVPGDLVIGDTAQASVSGSPGGTPVEPFWGSLDPDILSVDGSGRVVGLTQGTARLVAAAGPVADTVQVNVRRLVEQVIVTPGSHVFTTLGDSLPFEAEVLAFNGNALPNAEVTWTVTPSGVIEVSPSGMVRGIAPGTAELRADAHGVRGTASVTVAPIPVSLVLHPGDATLGPDGTLVFEASVLDAGGTAIPGSPVTWTTSDPSVVTVASNGRATAVAPGIAEIRAASGPFADTARIEVVAGAPAQLQLVSGADQGGLPLEPLDEPIRVRLVDGAGFPVPDAQVFWAASDGGSASPDPSTTDASGIAVTTWTLGSGSGTQTLTASAGAATLQVSASSGPPVAAGITIAPDSAAFVALNDTLAFSAVVVDPGASPIPGASVDWSVLNGTIASVDGSGRVTALAVGSTSLVATSGPAADTVPLVVTQVPDSVAVVPALDSIEVAETTQLSATVFDSGGSVIPGAVVGWNSSNVSVATVDPMGLVTGEAAGTSTIEASSGGAVGSALVTVEDATPSSIEIVGGTGQSAPAGMTVPDSLEVQVRSAFGVPVPGVTVTWTAGSGGAGTPGTSVTDGSGSARTAWTLGPDLGAQQLAATIEGDTVTFTATASGASRVFDRAAAGDRVTVIDDPADEFSFPDGDWTLSLWALPVDEGEGGFRFAFSGAWNAFAEGVTLYQNPDLGMNWTMSVRSPSSGGIMPVGVPPTEGVWQHLVIRRSGDTVRIWSNGVEFTAAGLEVTEAVPSSGPPTIGGRGDLFGDWFSGNIAQVTRWSSALTPGEIAALAGGTHPLDVNSGARDWYIPLGRDPEGSVGGSFTLQVTGTTPGSAPPVAPPSTP
jgi:uncharacterized protein YjdB